MCKHYWQEMLRWDDGVNYSNEPKNRKQGRAVRSASCFRDDTILQTKGTRLFSIQSEWQHAIKPDILFHCERVYPGWELVPGSNEENSCKNTKEDFLTWAVSKHTCTALHCTALSQRWPNDLRGADHRVTRVQYCRGSMLRQSQYCADHRHVQFFSSKW